MNQERIRRIRSPAIGATIAGLRYEADAGYVVIELDSGEGAVGAGGWGGVSCDDKVRIKVSPIRLMIDSELVLPVAMERS